MKKIFRFFKENIFPILVTLVCALLAWKNYVPNTILSGWDTLHPEFDFWLYFKRSLSGVWMEHQGLGAVASQSHPAELPKLLILGILYLFLPLELTRYLLFFLCLLSGGLGAYFLSNYILAIKWHKYIRTSSFLASMFYIFNLVTVQQFYVPLEMFAVHYALVPWLFLLGLKYIRQDGKRTLLFFILVTLFSSSMSHTATLFYVYLISFGLFVVFLNFKRGMFLVLVTILVNSFWIFPNVYYIVNHSQEVSNSTIHSNFTDEAFMQSQSFGDYNNLILSKNFLFNWREYDFKNGKFVDLLDEWKDHLDKPYVKEIGYSLFIISALGFFVSIFSKPKIALALFLPFLLCLFFLINENPPLIDLFKYIKEEIPLIKEGLRFPFTKFSIVYILILSIWFGFGSRFLINLLNKIRLGFIFFIFATASIFYFQLPQFQGYLISPSMKVNIPNNYFEVFKWFENQDASSRIAKLPLNTYWGWIYNDWGYQGAGFTWFGIKQPILDREFDRWSLHNESFFNEASFALYNNDKDSFKKTLEKYQVKYLLLDESVMNAGGDKELLKIPEIKSTIQDLKFFEVFSSGFLRVYDTGLALENVREVDEYTILDANLSYSKSDPIYQKYGNYVNDKNGLGLPFANFDIKGDVKFNISNNDLLITNNKLNSFAKLQINEKITENFDRAHGFPEPFNCDLNKIGSVFREYLDVGRRYLAENGGVSCDYFVFDTLKYDTAYVLNIKGENLKGRSLKIYLYNWETKRVELEELLPVGKFDSYYVIYPKDKLVYPKIVNEESVIKGGYTLNVETRSFGRISSENIVSHIEFIPFDINLVQELYVEPKVENINKQGNLEVLEVKKYGTALYKVRVKGKGLLQLGQGYEKGWKIYPKYEHVKVNSWSNGWIVDGNETGEKEVYIFFWPQLLEWIGFVLALSAFCIVPLDKKSTF